jgi:hypothetical protein
VRSIHELSNTAKNSSSWPTRCSKYLASHYSFEQRKAIVHSATGISDAVWTTFAEMGLTAIALPEADGGFGGGAVDLMAVMEACGEALVVEPLLDNVGWPAAGGALPARRPAGGAAAGPDRRHAALAFASLEPGRRYRPGASRPPPPGEGAGLGAGRQKSVVIGAPRRTADRVGTHCDGHQPVRGRPGAPGVALNPSRTVDGSAWPTCASPA